MAEPARFTPEELDRIEDALENLEGVHAIEDPSPQVRDVLESYRGVLVASREALPLAEVPQGALAAVFAEARGAATDTPEVAAAAPKEKRVGFFERLRKSFLVPSLALAGTAALVLWIARPQDAAESMDAPVSGEQLARAKGEPAPEVEAAAAEEQDRAGGKDAAKEAAQDQDDAEPAAEADNQPSPPPPAAAPLPEPNEAVADQDEVPDLKLPAPGDGARGMNKIGDVPKAGKKKTDTTKPAWDIVERADRARQAGDCAAARSDYMIATEDDDSGVRARAYAGLGLCSMLQGDDAGAEDSFERARGIDPGVAGFISAEREPDEYDSPKRKPRKKKSSAPRPASKSSKKAKPRAADQATMNPFGG